jgi:hypothetical protein
MLFNDAPLRTLARTLSLVTVAAAAEMAVSAMLVSMSSDGISLVSRSSSILSLGGKAGCLGDSDSVPDSVDSGGLALLGRLRLAEDVSWLGGIGENVSGTSSSL